jgi:hypothetical protein
MLCPNDGATLLMTDRQGVEIDYCPTCRGVWLDKGELDKIIDRSRIDDDDDDDEMRRASASASHGARPSAAPPPPPPPPPPPRDRYDDDRRYRDDRYYRDDRDDRGYKRKKKRSFLEDIFDFD